MSAASDFSVAPPVERVGDQCRAAAQDGFRVLLRIGLGGSTGGSDPEGSDGWTPER
ncbi:hypothetical protein AB0I39_22450 [Kitasatospora purpeofusca]|uniref:hypothetical protein n=1 Tax=Kitasatospora purpeofusca TaxID=67352 RepID=UPI0033FA8185